MKGSRPDQAFVQNANINKNADINNTTASIGLRPNQAFIQNANINKPDDSCLEDAILPRNCHNSDPPHIPFDFLPLTYGKRSPTCTRTTLHFNKLK